jgi:hypothetical protein
MKEILSPNCETCGVIDVLHLLVECVRNHNERNILFRQLNLNAGNMSTLHESAPCSDEAKALSKVSLEAHRFLIIAAKPGLRDHVGLTTPPRQPQQYPEGVIILDTKVTICPPGVANPEGATVECYTICFENRQFNWFRTFCEPPSQFIAAL